MRSFSKTVITVSLLLMVSILILSSLSVAASGFMPNPQVIENTVVIPTVVTLEMYELDTNGGKRADRCTSTSTAWGCTAYCGNQFPGTCAPGTPKPYPFGNSTTITIGIENHLFNNVQQGYLHNVTTQEIGPQTGSQGNKPLSAVEAQAIAARTYLYQRMSIYDTLDNSNTYQVYIPYRYDALTGVQQARVQEGMAHRYYMTEPTSTEAIEANFGQNNDGDTTQGAHSYLKSVKDPISAAYGYDYGTGYGGMSSMGASRWSFGHTSSQGPVAPNHPNYPHDSAGFGDFWSVQWSDAKQILTHYYTDIHVRDANNSSAIVTPAARWVPLQIRWSTPSGAAPVTMCAGNVIPIEVWVQNSGTTTWPSGGNVYLKVQNLPGLAVQATAMNGASYPTELVPPGETYTATILYEAPSNVSDGYIAAPFFEMFQGSTPFNQLEAGKSWPNYFVQINIVECDNAVYLPLSSSRPETTGEPLR